MFGDKLRNRIGLPKDYSRDNTNDFNSRPPKSIEDYYKMLVEHNADVFGKFLDLKTNGIIQDYSYTNYIQRGGGKKTMTSIPIRQSTKGGSNTDATQHQQTAFSYAGLVGKAVLYSFIGSNTFTDDNGEQKSVMELDRADKAENLFINFYNDDEIDLSKLAFLLGVSISSLFVLKPTEQFTKTQMINVCLTLVREIPNLNGLDIQAVYRMIDRLTDIFRGHPMGTDQNREAKRSVYSQFLIFIQEQETTTVYNLIELHGRTSVDFLVEYFGNIKEKFDEVSTLIDFMVEQFTYNQDALEEFQTIMDKLPEDITDPLGWIDYITESTLGQEKRDDGWRELIIEALDGFIDEELPQPSIPKDGWKMTLKVNDDGSLVATGLEKDAANINDPELNAIRQKLFPNQVLEETNNKYTDRFKMNMLPEDKDLNRFLDLASKVYDITDKDFTIDTMKPILEQFGLTDMEQGGLYGDYPRYSTDREATYFLAQKDNTILMACRGTEGANTNDYITDIGGAWNGFTDRGNIQQSQLKERLDSIVDIGQTPVLYITGHSLGAATATKIMEYVLKGHPTTQIDSILFASPSVFKDKEDADEFERLASNHSIGIVNVEGDVITTDGFNHHAEGITTHIDRLGHKVNYGSGEYTSSPIRQFEDAVATLLGIGQLSSTHTIAAMRNSIDMLGNTTDIDTSLVNEFIQLGSSSAAKILMMTTYSAAPTLALTGNAAYEFVVADDYQTAFVSVSLMLLSAKVSQFLAGRFNTKLSKAETTFVGTFAAILPGLKGLLTSKKQTQSVYPQTPTPNKATPYKATKHRLPSTVKRSIKAKQRLQYGTPSNV